MDYDRSGSQRLMRRAWLIIGGMAMLAAVFGVLGRREAPETTEVGMTLGPRQVPVTLDYPTSGVTDDEFAFAIGGQPEIGYISREGIEPQAIQYAQVNGLAILEGDIILDKLGFTPDQSGVGVRGRTPHDYRWTNGIIPYEIAPDLANPQRVRDAVAHWEQYTALQFVERTPANSAQSPNYIRFQTSSGCSSYVGMVGGRQTINLAPQCSTGATIHEVGHAVGLWHEQSRADRDQYITVRFENIIPAAIFNFQQHIRDGQDLGAYDYDSIMHYPRWAFSRNGKDTIEPKDESKQIGQRGVLSAGDLAAVEVMYEGIADE